MLSVLSAPAGHPGRLAAQGVLLLLHAWQDGLRGRRHLLPLQRCAPGGRGGRVRSAVALAGMRPPSSAAGLQLPSAAAQASCSLGPTRFCQRSWTGARLADTLPGAGTALLHSAVPTALWACRYSIERLKELDAEGRCVVTDHGAFVLFNVYGPAIAGDDKAEARFAFKLAFYEVRPLKPLPGTGPCCGAVGARRLTRCAAATLLCERGSAERGGARRCCTCAWRPCARRGAASSWLGI